MVACVHLLRYNEIVTRANTMLREQHIGADDSTSKRKRTMVHLLRCDSCDYEWRATGLVVLLCPVCGSFEVEKKVDLGLDLI